MTAAVAASRPGRRRPRMVDTPQFGGAVGLGHRRLSIIDLSTGISPCGTPIARARSCSATKSTTIVTCATTSRAGARGFSRPRTPRSSSKAGVSKARRSPKLEGMFAFAIWDLRTAEWIWRTTGGDQAALLLSQPMPGTIAFASEIKPLLGLTANRGQLAGPLRISALQLVSWASDHIRGSIIWNPAIWSAGNPPTATSVRDAIAALTASSDRFARPTLRMPFGRSSIVR